MERRDPPKPQVGPKNPREDWSELLEPLAEDDKAHEWHHVKTFDTTAMCAQVAWKIRNNLLSGQPPGIWDATQRENDLYVVYCGPDFRE